MSGSKKWVPSKVSRASWKASSENLSIDNNVNRGAPPSPPTRIPSSGTPETAYLEYASGSTFISRGSSHNLLSYGSSIDSNSTSTGVLTPSPSTTPPKKTWERNYRSFLKKSLKNRGSTTAPPISSTPSFGHSRNATVSTIPFKLIPTIQPDFQATSNDASLMLLSRTLDTADNKNDGQEDLEPSLADRFVDLSTKHKRTSSATAATHKKNTLNDQISFTAPSSPSSIKDSSTKGGTLFKRLRNKTKSHDCLDATIRRGVDRKVMSTTPPESCGSHRPLTQFVASSFDVVTHSQVGDQRAALHEQLQAAPTAITSFNRGRVNTEPFGINDKSDSSHSCWNQRHNIKSVATTCLEGDSLGSSQYHVPISSFNLENSMFSRVQSMGCNLVIHEGVPALTLKEEEELTRERKKAFTDFHNMGIDSSSAFLGGEDSSLHSNHLFLSTIPHSLRSVRGKARSQYSLGDASLHTMNNKETVSPSPATLSSSGPGPNLNEAGNLTPVRALQPLQGPENWSKGERHAITPAVLCMCPIQVLNNIMSKDEELLMKSSISNTVTQGGYGIGSIVSEDYASEQHESNGWFFGEHHNPVLAGSLHSHKVDPNGNASLSFEKVLLGQATLGMRSFVGELYGWCTGVFLLWQNYLFEYRESDSLNGLPWGYAMLQSAEVYPHKHFTNALHLEFFERPCVKSGRRNLLIRVESKNERDRWVVLLQSAARMTIKDLYIVDESDKGPEFGRGRYAVVRPAKKRTLMRGKSFSDFRSHENLCMVSSGDNLTSYNKTSNTDLITGGAEYDCALKIIDKKEFWTRVKRGQERADTLVRESAIQTTLAVQGSRTAGFLKLRRIFETGEQLIMELELLKGTDLFQHISSRGLLDEIEAAHIMRDLLNCISIMDQIGVAHRDIKPANLLMCSEDSDAKVKLADYGMASFVGVDNLVRGRCGTPGFVAPEILLTGVNGGYQNKVDIFSAGVTLYVMLVGYEPFYGESDEELINVNEVGKVDFPHADWQRVSIEGRDLVERMLEVDPLKRIGPSEALRHPWITRRAPLIEQSLNNDQ